METKDILIEGISEKGIVFGNPTAPKKVIAFMNLRCPYCRKFWNNHIEIIKKYVETEQAVFIVKLFNKEKPGLQRGNIMHNHVSVNNPPKAIEEIQAIYDTQDTWGEIEDLSKVDRFAKEELKQEVQSNYLYLEEVVKEAVAANIKFVPTVIVGDAIFDEHITAELFEEILK
jgi:protein-disulfide isomerase